MIKKMIIKTDLNNKMNQNTQKEIKIIKKTEKKLEKKNEVFSKNNPINKSKQINIINQKSKTEEFTNDQTFSEIDEEIYSFEIEKGNFFMISKKLSENETIGELFEIYSFFIQIKEKIQAPSIDFEDFYISINYRGTEFLRFIHELHIVLLNCLMKFHFSEKNKKCFSEKISDQAPFISTINGLTLKKIFRSFAIRAVWPKILLEFLYFYQNDQNECEYLIKELEGISVSNYNLLEPKIKLSAMKFLIKIIISNKIVECQKSEFVDYLKDFYKEQIIKTKKLKFLYNKRSQNTKKLENYKLKSTISKINSIILKLKQIKIKIKKCESELIDIKRKEYFGYKQLKCLGIDKKKNLYFLFHKDINSIYVQKIDKTWITIRGDIKNLNFIDKNEIENNEVITEIIKLIKNKIIIDIKKEEIYKIEKESEIREERTLMGLLNEGIGSFLENLKNKLEEKTSRQFLNKRVFKKLFHNDGFINLSVNFLKEFIITIENIYSEYLEIEELFWINKNNRYEYQNLLTQAEILEDIYNLINFVNINFGNVRKIRQDKKNNVKMLYWHYHLRSTKKKFRDLLMQKDKESIFIAILIFNSVILQFIARKMKKLGIKKFCDLDNFKIRQIKKNRTSSFFEKKTPKYKKKCKKCYIMSNKEVFQCGYCSKNYHKKCFLDSEKDKRRPKCERCLKNLKK